MHIDTRRNQSDAGRSQSKKLREFIEWQLTKPDCNVCTNLYNECEKDPPCHRCFVDLFDANSMIIDLYSRVRDQVRVSPMGDIIALDYGAIIHVLDLLGIEDKKEAFEGIQRCFQIEREIATDLPALKMKQG